MLENAVLITGAGRRIGLHIAKRLFDDGHTVIAHYRKYTDDINILTDMGITVIQADLNHSNKILQFVANLKTCCLSFRAIIHNASSFEATSENLSKAAIQFDNFFNVHMKAPFLINQSLQFLMVGEINDPANIIHITDINAKNPTPIFDIYGATKAGLHNLTLVLAKKFAPTIKVNSIAPGPVLFAEQHSGQTRGQILNETLLAKEGGAESVYLAIKSLLTNPFITGSSITVDGGRRLTKS
ncbi:MAG: SDR family NAD(P)-dependent oxidoreductase [Piscirickettsiaceae bacterium]|nr:SDR family NAD(P)-dependent oxidoreductase [Piscirickettsiaceae bacterium]